MRPRPQGCAGDGPVVLWSDEGHGPGDVEAGEELRVEIDGKPFGTVEVWGNDDAPHFANFHSGTDGWVPLGLLDRDADGRKVYYRVPGQQIVADGEYVCDHSPAECVARFVRNAAAKEGIVPEFEDGDTKEVKS